MEWLNELNMSNEHTHTGVFNILTIYMDMSCLELDFELYTKWTMAVQQIYFPFKFSFSSLMHSFFRFMVTGGRYSKLCYTFIPRRVLRAYLNGLCWPSIYDFSKRNLLRVMAGKVPTRLTI